MKLHPAMKKAKRIARRWGIDTYPVGTLAMHVVCREYSSRPLIVDVILSSHEDKAKFNVCYLSEGHPMYPQVRAALHGFEFNYQ